MTCLAGCQFINDWNWRLPLALAGVPGLFILFAGIMLPDSPNSLAERSKPEEALVVLKRIRGVEDVDVEYADILEAARQSRLIKNPYGEHHSLSPYGLSKECKPFLALKGHSLKYRVPDPNLRPRNIAGLCMGEDFEWRGLQEKKLIASVLQPI